MSNSHLCTFFNTCQHSSQFYSASEYINIPSLLPFTVYQVPDSSLLFFQTNQSLLQTALLADVDWVCKRCTFTNPDSSKTCELCGSSRED